MNWKLGSVLAAALLVFGSPGRADDAAPASRGAALLEYRPPAQIPFPDDNPYSAAKAELGRRLFFDPVFSNSRTMACATCHDPKLSWGDGRAHAQGDDANDMSLRSPTLLDVAWMPHLGWDGKFRNLESVAFAPITAAANMNLKEDALLARLDALSPLSPPPFPIARSPAATSNWRWRLTSARSSRARRRSTAGSRATRRRSTRPPNAVSIFSTAGRIVRAAIAAGRSATAPSTISERPGATISDAGGCFQPRSSFATPSRRRPCGTRRAGRPICTTAPCRPCGR